jgi:hypothetical protein
MKIYIDLIMSIIILFVHGKIMCEICESVTYWSLCWRDGYFRWMSYDGNICYGLARVA